MFVNISRSKLLINSKRLSRKNKKKSDPAMRCNHCGGPIRFNGEIQTCLMCAREKGHVCDLCANINQVESAKKKKTG